MSTSVIREYSDQSLSIGLLKNLIRWRWISILVMGVFSNLAINIIFDFKYSRDLVSFSIDEYLNAVLASIFLLEGSRLISKKLDQKFSWTEGFAKRMCVQFGLQLLFLIAMLNALLISVTYFIYDGFYDIDDLLVINISVVSLTFFFILIDTGIYFFNRWKQTTNKPDTYDKNSIRLSVGKLNLFLNTADVRMACSESGVTFIISADNRKYPYFHSLDTLMSKLDSDVFFRANRQAIISASMVQSYKTLEYGKIEVVLHASTESRTSLIISRTKAASFRRWLKQYSKT